MMLPCRWNTYCAAPSARATSWEMSVCKMFSRGAGCGRRCGVRKQSGVSGVLSPSERAYHGCVAPACSHPTGPALDDPVLLTAAQRGDQEAFAALVDRHRPAVFGYLRARVLQPADAEDLSQEAFLRCYLHLADLEPTPSLRPWLLGVARNVLREFVRKHRRRRQKETAWTELCLELDETAAPAADEPAYQDQMEQLPNCMAALGESARRAIELRYTAQLGVDEIGNRLRRSAGAAKLLMFRARQALKRCLNRDHPDAANEPDDG